MLEAIQRNEFLMHDLSNGTLDAAIQLTGGYDSYPQLQSYEKASKVFKMDRYIDNSLDHSSLQIEIIEKLKKMGIVEWIVENFYNDLEDRKREVIWDERKRHFKIIGKPRYYLLLNEHLIMHGFFPSPY